MMLAIMQVSARCYHSNACFSSCFPFYFFDLLFAMRHFFLVLRHFSNKRERNRSLKRTREILLFLSSIFLARIRAIYYYIQYLRMYFIQTKATNIVCVLGREKNAFTLSLRFFSHLISVAPL